MKYAILFLFISLLLGCSRAKDGIGESESSAAIEIVNSSIIEHGGLDTWKKLKSISFNKVTILFDSMGATESNVIQRHFYNFTPELSGTIKWFEKGDSIKVVFEKGEAIKYVNNQSDKDSKEAKNTVDASLYVLFQPFKLLDEGTTLKRVGVDSLDGRAVNIIEPIYAGHQEGDDQWFFYFDTNSSELMANLVNHNGRFSLIKNLTFDYTSLLKLHQHRKSYFVDSKLNIQYLRAEYFYTNYELSFIEQL